MQHKAPTYVVETSENDILLGRGKPVINYIGNRKFRELVRTRKEEYASSSRSHTKELIAREILEVIQQRGGRFLQRVTSEMREQDQSVPGNPKVWRVVDLNAALSKTKQTLRDREYVRSPERQREAVAFIEEQRRRALGQQPVSCSLSQLLSQRLDSPDQADLPHLQLLQYLQIVVQRRKEVEARAEQVELLVAQQLADNRLPRQPVLPHCGDVRSDHPLLCLADAQRLRQFLQSQGEPGLSLPSATTHLIQPPLTIARGSTILGTMNTATGGVARIEASKVGGGHCNIKRKENGW